MLGAKKVPPRRVRKHIFIFLESKIVRLSIETIKKRAPPLVHAKKMFLGHRYENKAVI